MPWSWCVRSRSLFLDALPAQLIMAPIGILILMMHLSSSHLTYLDFCAILEIHSCSFDEFFSVEQSVLIAKKIEAFELRAQR